MKTLLFFTVLLLTGASQAQTFLRCQDSSREFYQVTKQGATQAAFQKMSGKKVVASRVGLLEAAGQLNTYYISISDEKGRFFLVGSDHGTGGFFTGTTTAFGPYRQITCKK